jgi:hypothetical protein
MEQPFSSIHSNGDIGRLQCFDLHCEFEGGGRQIRPYGQDKRMLRSVWVNTKIVVVVESLL